MTDVVSASNEEIVSLCVRYVDSRNDIRKMFFEFLDAERITSPLIAKKNSGFFERKVIPIEKGMRLYGGAPNMHS